MSTMPLVPSANDSGVVYAPGASVVTIAASALPVLSGNAPTAAKAGASVATQLSLFNSIAPLLQSCRRGSASVPATPNAPSVGPTARTTIRLPAPAPFMTKQTVGAPATPPTRVRTARVTMRAVGTALTVRVAAELVTEPMVFETTTV